MIGGSSRVYYGYYYFAKIQSPIRLLHETAVVPPCNKLACKSGKQRARKQLDLGEVRLRIRVKSCCKQSRS